MKPLGWLVREAWPLGGDVDPGLSFVSEDSTYTRHPIAYYVHRCTALKGPYPRTTESAAIN